MQCKDIPDRPVLEFLRDLPPFQWGGQRKATWFDIQPRRPEGMPTVIDVMPPLPNEKLALAKMGMLIRRGLVDGCTCGCRGEFELTDKGREFLEAK